MANPWQNDEHTSPEGADSDTSPLLYPDLESQEHQTSVSTSAPQPPPTQTAAPSSHSTKPQKTPPTSYEDAPPSYEAIISKDIPQLHDNYDHLRGPPGQRGRDDKIRIPFDTYGGAGGSSSNGAGSSSGNYGATGIEHSPTSTQAPELGLTGQIALHSDEEDESFTQDIDRLLGADTDADNAEADGCDHGEDDSRSCWTVVGDGQAWVATAYMIIVLLPWSLFCFIWTLGFMVAAGVTMMFPPLGYFFTIFAITSWRALARVDLVMSAALVSDEVRQRSPFFTSSVYIPCEPGPAWTPPRLFGREMPLPEFIRTRLQRRHAARGRRPRNLVHRAVRHLKANISNRHSVRSMFYFLFWKLLLAIPVFIVVVLFFSLSLPFMFCFLASLLAVSRGFAVWQYKWAVTWLSEKPAPIVV
ncbi:hypothetical protein EMPS_02519 [Entomortierella parvispora]|uniref:Transmembrane protein n=1 Tax=Entomortierella parvispora TaxID=205924 RepID=A0A9P3H4V6_9FUNG|nr:hypothetical protein EMPS_02519 [Entomortierella parvispora]